MSFLRKKIDAKKAEAKEKFKAIPVVKAVTTGYTTTKNGYKATKKAFVGDGKCPGPGCKKSIPSGYTSCGKPSCVNSSL